jgi:CRISPR-associated protein Cas1
MIKRTISIGKPAYIRYQNKQLLIEFVEDDTKASLAVEDIGLMVMDHPRITVTQKAMSALISNNTAVLWCDEKHMPQGMFFSLGQQNKEFTQKLRFQMNASVPLKKQLWKQIIQSKIRNQAAVLDALEKPNRKLLRMAKEVSPGDPNNLEGQAANAYWKILFEEIEGFTRKRHGASPNNLLNYGYAILRAVVARSLTGSGCLPAIGIHHRNKYNPFCLADDVMEPYRPYVDLLVTDMIRETGELPEELDKTHKAELLRIPTLDVIIGKETSPLLHAVLHTTASLARCYEGSQKKLALPEL